MRRRDFITLLGGTVAWPRAAEKGGVAKSVAVKSTSEAAEMLADIATPGDLVLVKGSRSARTERVLEEFGRRQPAEGVR